MKRLIVVADWVDDSLSCQEFLSAVYGFARNPEKLQVSFVASSFSDIHTSYLIKQIVEIENRFSRPLETVIFQNTDARTQTSEPISASRGADFLILRLINGIIVCGPNAGYDFSLLRDQIEEIYCYSGVESGSQFRSRDFFSKICVHLTQDDKLKLEKVSKNLIPRLEGYHIGHIDNYGNIKTTIRHSDLKGKYQYHDLVNITINNVRRQVKYVDNLFGAEPGELIIYPGSSGEKNDPYLEIAVRKVFTENLPVTGASKFVNPHPGSKITLN